MGINSPGWEKVGSLPTATLFISSGLQWLWFTAWNVKELKHANWEAHNYTLTCKYVTFRKDQLTCFLDAINK